MAVTITRLSTQQVLADRAELAQSLPARLIGLLSRSTLRDGEALILPHCSAIHTCFMRFPIDVVFVSTRPRGILGTSAPFHGAGGIVVKTVQHLKPFRLTWAVGADTAIELPAGTLSRIPAPIGELLIWNPSASTRLS